MFSHVAGGNLECKAYILATIAILLIIIRSNKRIKMLLNKSIIADDLFGATFLILTFYALKVFMLWWVAIIIALSLAFAIDIIFRHK